MQQSRLFLLSTYRWHLQILLMHLMVLVLLLLNKPFYFQVCIEAGVSLINLPFRFLYVIIYANELCLGHDPKVLGIREVEQRLRHVSIVERIVSWCLYLFEICFGFNSILVFIFCPDVFRIELLL